LNEEIARSEPDDQRRNKTAHSNYYVEKIPSVSAKTTPAQTEQANNDIDDVDESDHEKKVICYSSQMEGTNR
jgi:hypothetical protein